jgi:hypothetical protein
VRDTTTASASVAGTDAAVAAASGDAVADVVSDVSKMSTGVVVQAPTPNPYIVTLELSQNGQMAAALLLAQEGPRAMEMDSTNKEERVVSGGKALFCQKLYVAIQRGMIDSLQPSKTQV